MDPASENAWEEEASLPSRIFFHWYGRIMGVTDKPLEMSDLPKVPEYLKSDQEHARFIEVWANAKASWTFIAPIKNKKAPKSKEAGKEDEKNALYTLGYYSYNWE